MIIFARSLASGKADYGKPEARVGDVVTFFDDGGAWATRLAAEVKGAIIVTEPFPGEKPQFVALEKLIKIERRRKGTKT